MHNSHINGNNWMKDIFGAGKSGKSNDSADKLGIGSSFREMLANRSGIQEVFDRIAAQNPDVKINKGKPDAGIEGTDRHFGRGRGDHASLDENLLAAMAGNSDLAGQVGNALRNFFDSVAGSSSMEGAYVQRSISITITTVRMNVSQREEGTGDLLSSQEVQTAFREQLQNLINRFFGIEPAAEGETGGEASGDESGDDGAAAESNGKAAGYAMGAFSFEMFFSASMLSKAQNQDGSWMAAQAMQFGMSFGASSFSGDFQDFANGILPGAIGRFLGQGNQGGGNGPFTSLLNGAFGQFGMSVSGFAMTAGGFSLKGGESRDLLSELFEYLMAGRNNPYENDKTAEAEEVAEVPEEVAAE